MGSSKVEEESNDTKRRSFVASVLRIHEGVERGEGVSPWERLLFPRLSAVSLTCPLGKCWIRINSVAESLAWFRYFFLFFFLESMFKNRGARGCLNVGTIALLYIYVYTRDTENLMFNGEAFDLLEWKMYSLKLRRVNRDRGCVFRSWEGEWMCVENILWSGKFGDFDRGWFL